MGLSMKKKAVAREYKPRYQKATKKEKKALLDEFTRLTGCHRNPPVKRKALKTSHGLHRRQAGNKIFAWRTLSPRQADGVLDRIGFAVK